MTTVINKWQKHFRKSRLRNLLVNNKIPRVENTKMNIYIISTHGVSSKNALVLWFSDVTVTAEINLLCLITPKDENDKTVTLQSIE